MAYTDLTSMRNDFLTKTQAQLLAKDFSTAAETDLIISGALVRAFDSVNNFDPISLTALSMIGGVGDLNVYLSDPSNRDAFEKVLANSQAMTAVAASSTAMTAVAASSTAMTAVAASTTAFNTVLASSTAMTAVAASSTAMTAVAASSTAMTAVAASSTAMTAVAASSTAMTAVAASSTAMTAVAASSTAMTAVFSSNTATNAVFANSNARLAIYNNDTALTKLQETPARVQRLINGGIAGVTVVYSVASSSSFNFTAVNTKTILLRRWYNGGEADCINYRRGASAAGAATGVISPNGNGRTLYQDSTFAHGSTTGTYNSNGSYPTSNNDTANFVAAANGLRRDSWWQGYTLYVYYIVV